MKRKGHYKDFYLAFQFKDFLKFIKTISTSLLHILWGSSEDDVEEEVDFVMNYFCEGNKDRNFVLQKFGKATESRGAC